MFKKRTAEAMPEAAPEAPETPAAPAVSGKASRAVRLFLMVAGGLAAPCLALAAFFLSSPGTESKPKAAQSGLVTTPTRPAGTTLAPPAAVPTTTTTTTRPAVTPTPARDPFAPLVTAAPAGGTPAR